MEFSVTELGDRTADTIGKLQAAIKGAPQDDKMSLIASALVDIHNRVAALEAAAFPDRPIGGQMGGV
jgi:hypothetical protein